MTTTAPGETVAVGFATMMIQSTSTGKTFTFNHNLSGSTTNKHILIATSGFESSPGLPTSPPLLTPDYTFPSLNFLSPAGDTIRFCQNSCTGLNILDTRTFASLPTDGTTSLNFPANSMVGNTPTNFAGTMGSVDLTPPPPTPTGDYNGDLVVNAADYTVWRNAFGTTVTEMGSGADGHADGVIDDLDYAFWRDNFGVVLAGSGGGAGIVVPEPALLTVALPGLWAFFLAMTRVQRARAGQNRPGCQTSTLKSLHLVNSVSQFLRTLSFVSTWLLAAAWAAAAPTVWTGPTTSFAKASGADFTLPVNQDHLTASVALTRGTPKASSMFCRKRTSRVAARPALVGRLRSTILSTRSQPPIGPPSISPPGPPPTRATSRETSSTTTRSSTSRPTMCISTCSSRASKAGARAEDSPTSAQHPCRNRPRSSWSSPRCSPRHFVAFDEFLAPLARGAGSISIVSGKTSPRIAQ